MQPSRIVSAAIFSVTLMLAGTGVASENSFVFIPQADSPGNDYSRVGNSSFEDCTKRCDAQNECNAFTYNQRQGVCFLKRSANRATAFYAFAITGVKRAPSGPASAVHSDDSGNYFVIISRADSHGNDYARITLFTFEECQNSCKADKGCNAFTYNQAASVCFLKSAANQWTNFYAWATTGIKVASLQSEEKSANTAPVESQANSPSEQAQVPQPPPAPSQPQVATPSEQERFPQPTAEPPQNEAGGMLLQKNCSRCHSIDATGQSPLQLAPPLREIYLRYPIEQLEYGFAEGMGSKHREMPQIQFSSVQVSAILTYLGSITGVAPSARTRAANPSETQPP